MEQKLEIALLKMEVQHGTLLRNILKESVKGSLKRLGLDHIDYINCMVVQ